jgi:hypothetical protein
VVSVFPKLDDRIGGIVREAHSPHSLHYLALVLDLDLPSDNLLRGQVVLSLVYQETNGGDKIR